jgi:hypothetical protein
MSEPARTYIVNRPLYRVIVVLTDDDIDVEIKLTAKGKQYARNRAKANHRRMFDYDDYIAEIMTARDAHFINNQQER